MSVQLLEPRFGFSPHREVLVSLDDPGALMHAKHGPRRSLVNRPALGSQAQPIEKLAECHRIATGLIQSIEKSAKYLILMVRPRGFEPLTYSSGGGDTRRPPPTYQGSQFAPYLPPARESTGAVAVTI